jgi:hypothetical protein
MATNRQLEANRRNAKRSTGPKTEKGKAMSRRNALKHGLTAERMLLDDENAEHFEALCEQLRLELKPVGVREEMCVDRLAQTQWRLMRVPGYEVEILKWIKYADDRPVLSHEFKRSALISFVLSADAFGKLARHEAHLARQAQDILEELVTLKGERLAAAAAEVALNAPNLGQVTIVPPATPLIGKVIEARAVPEPQVEKPEPVASESKFKFDLSVD